MSTIFTVGALLAMASASPTVRFGRFSRSVNDLPLPRLVKPNFWTKIVLGPISLMLLRSDSSKPRMSDVMPTMAVMPMTTPRTVRADRSLFERSVSIAIRTTSVSRPRRSFIGSLPPQGFDGIEAGGAHRGIQAEPQADDGRQ